MNIGGCGYILQYFSLVHTAILLLIWGFPCLSYSTSKSFNFINRITKTPNRNWETHEIKLWYLKTPEAM